MLWVDGVDQMVIIRYFDLILNKPMNNSDNEQMPAISHSLQADMATGWKPKLKIIGPMPLNFDNPGVDRSIMALIHQQSAFYEVVYLGARPISSFKLHELIAKHYRYKYSYLLYNDFAHLKPFFKKFYSLFESESKRPFYGMNPNIHKKELIFDSCFEAGNLDCAVRLRANQYDLLLRVDSNTVGHVLWYYFRVSNPDCTHKTVKFNLCNLRNNKSAYQRGMRPFVKREEKEWQQQGHNLEITYERLRYHKQNLVANLENNQSPPTYRKLAFQLNLSPNETIEVAYSIPYTYSQLLQNLKEFKKKAQSLQGVQIEYDYEYESLSGLQIPIIKIRSGAAGGGKYCVFIIGRQHPGESNSSYVMKGTIQQLLSGQETTMKILRYCDFVIIPMMNPDGVVAGNFRTSLLGKDLNRLFKSKDTTLTPQIQMARRVFTQLYELYKKKLLLFLDYHGHSTRKNAFLLGPGIIDAQLLTEIRVLPKILANYSEIFRYPSCCFRLEENKRTTARALFGKLAGLSFTVETSNWAYYCSGTKEVVYMQREHFEQLGREICRSVEEFLVGKTEQKGKFQLKPKEEPKKINFNKSKQDLAIRNSITSRQRSEYIRKTTKEQRTHTQTAIPKQSQEPKFYFQEERPPSVAEVNSSDEMSENGMDSESEGEDMQKDKFKKYIKAASEMLVEFEKIYYGDLYRKANSKYKLGQANSKSNKLLFQKEKKKKVQPVQACLRPNDKKPESSFKTEQKQTDQKSLLKRIFLEDSIYAKAGTLSQIRSERQEETLAYQKKEGKKFKFADSHQKLKGKNNIFKDQIGFTEEVNNFQKLQFKFTERSLQNRKREQSLQKMKFSPKSNVHIIFNRDKEPSVGMGLLPIIRGTKALGQETQISSNNNLFIKSKERVQKNRQRFTDMLLSEQLLNKSAVVNVLKLSRIEKQKPNKND